ncbi:hypothetical protein [Streptomyces sp. NPDC049744]|uniref:hypothetical protein n=1 Tax=Streptomyces sp. NPDC049744 TaxID=3154359 RepID=UPI00342FCEA7
MPPPWPAPPGRRVARYGCAPVDDGRFALAGLAVEGKVVRGSRHGSQAVVHLLIAVLYASPAVISQRQIAAKNNEIPAFTPVDLRGHVITADALLTQTGHAQQTTTQGAPCI